MKLEELKHNQNVFKSNLNEIKKEGLKQKSKKMLQKIQKRFTMHKAKLSNYLMIILQLHLRLSIKQFTKKKLNI